jgi:medium-chain acyl-[acyl-carrier-protein] hydrolase
MSTKQQASPWIRLPRPSPDAQLRLFCFPYAGGSASMYLKWPYILAPSVEVCLVELPGRGERLREPPLTNMTRLIEGLTGAFSHWLDKPVAFFGHSMGGVISFELAHALRAEGKPTPVHLFLSGCRPPGLPALRDLKYSLPDPQFIDELRRLGGTPPEVLGNAELLSLVLPTLRADFELMERHNSIHTAPLDCGITAMGGLDDPEVTSDDLAHWAEATTANFSIDMYPGDHFFIRSAETKVMIRILLSLRSLCHHQPSQIYNLPTHGLA